MKSTQTGRRFDLRRVLTSFVPAMVMAAGIMGADCLAAPLLLDIAPTHGPAGTAVTLTGAGFDTGAAHSVTMAAAACTVTGLGADHLTFTVPAGALSGPVQVTAAGTSLTTPVPFTVTRTITGTWTPPPGVDAADWRVGTAFGETGPGAGGAFQVTVAAGAPTIVAAVRSDADPVFLALVTGADTAVTLDAASTAVATVFLSPFVATLDDARAAAAALAIAGLAETAALADLMFTHAADGADFMDRLDVSLAVGRALAAATAPAAQAQPIAAMDFEGGVPVNTAVKFLNPPPAGDEASAPIQFTGPWLAAGTVLKAPTAETPGHYTLTVEGREGSPLDWSCLLYRLSVSPFTQGLASVDALSWRTAPQRYYPEPVDRTRVGSKLFSRYLAVIDMALGEVFRVDTGDLLIPARYPGVYAARAFSGNLFFGTEFLLNYNMLQAAFIDSMGGGRQEWNAALYANLVASVLDAVSVIVDAKDFLGNSQMANLVFATVYEVEKATALLQARREAGGRVTREEYWEMYYATVKAVAKRLYAAVSEAGIKKVLTGIGKTFVKVIDISGKVSAAGQSAERMAGLWGGHALAAESAIIVIGDPFEPNITSFSPRRGMRGSIVAIEGYNFDAGKDDTGKYKTTVVFGRTGTIVEGEDPAINEGHEAEVLYATANSLTVRVPDAAYTAFIYVSTDKGRTGTYALQPPYRQFEVIGPLDGVVLTVTPDPVVTTGVIRITGSNFPQGGAFDYPMNDDAGQNGAVISERGAPHRRPVVIFDGNADSPVLPANVSATEMVVTAPAAASANEPHTVAVRMGDWVSPAASFTIYNPAILTGAVWGSNLIVTTTADNTQADGELTLREAILWAKGGKEALGRDLTRHEAIEPAGTAREEDFAGDNVGADRRNAVSVNTGLRGQVMTLASPLPAPGSGDTFDLNGLVIQATGTAWNLSGVHHSELQDAVFQGGAMGILMDAGATGNYIHHAAFTGLSGTGIHLAGGATGNRVDWTTVETTGGHGAYLGGGAGGNRIENTGFSGGGANGLFFDTSAAGNIIHNVRVTGTAASGHGLLMSGPDVAFNRFSNDNAASGESLSAFNANGGWGIVLENGAHHNLVHPGQVRGNHLGGILITGAATDFNVIGRESDTLPRSTDVYDNGGPGALLTAGVEHTVLRYLSFAGNNGDGIRLEGPDCRFNRIQSCIFGVDVFGTTVTEAMQNQGSGIHLTAGAHHNLIGGKLQGSSGWRNAIANNRDHGILIEGADSAFNVINQTHVGSLAPGWYGGPPYHANGGHGIVLTGGTHNNIVGDRHQWLDNHIVAHTGGAGILIEGEGTDRNLIAGNQIGAEHLSALPPGNNIGIHIRNGARGNVIGRVGSLIAPSVFPPPAANDDYENILTFYSGNSIGNNTYGIVIENAGADLGEDGAPTGANIIINNDIGCRENGVSGAANDVGIRLLAGARGNIVGGDLSGEGNRIHYNRTAGIDIDGCVIADRRLENRIANNYIYGSGMNQPAWAHSHLAGYSHGMGVLVRGGSAGQGVGIADGPKNRIMSAMVGVYVDGAAGIAIQNNDIFGSAAVASIAGVVLRESTGCTVGGAARNRGNRIGTSGSANAGEGGVILSGGSGHAVAGNLIGLNGIAIQANAGWGVVVSGSSDNRIGDDLRAFGNTIAGNTLGGVWITGAAATGNQVRGNRIGVFRPGFAGAGNGGPGVLIDGGASQNTLGGRFDAVINGTRLTMATANTIAGNAADGVRVAGGAGGNSILFNSITGNGGKGIALDAGNAMLPAPVITSLAGGSVSGTVDSGSVPAGSTVQVFADPDGEGDQFLGETQTDASGTWSLWMGNPVFSALTATATHLTAGHTSAFSVDVPVPTGGLGIARTAAGTAAFSGRTGQVVLDLAVTATGTDAQILSMRFSATGTIHDALFITDARLYVDVDGSGTLTAPDLLISGAGGAQRFDADNGTLNLVVDAGIVEAGRTERWLLVFDFAAATPLGATVQVRLTDAAAVTAATRYPSAPLIVSGNFPLASDTIEAGLTIQDALVVLKLLCGLPDDGLIRIGDLTGNGAVGLEDVLLILQKIAGVRGS